VFIVGDPKQSIYRFRRAEPRVFEAAREFVEQGLGGSVLACDHTRRNAPEVLAVLNDVFDATQQRGEFSGFRRHTTEHGPDAQAGVWALPRVPRLDKSAEEPPGAAWRDSLTTPRHEPDELLREQEARQVALAVQELVLQHAVAAGEIQVLCRKRASLRLVAQALAALHLPFAAAEDHALLDAAEARDLLAVLDVLASPQHRLSLAQALRCPVFGASDDDLIALAQASAAHGCDWWRALVNLEAPSPALARARELLPRWQAAAQRLPPHDLIDLVVAEGEVRERIAAAVPPEQCRAALTTVDALLARALMLDGARYATPYNFVRALKRRAIKVPAPVHPEAVQLMTIHGAKGLEARAVFVMDSDPEPQSSETATLLVDWPVELEHPRHCAFLYSEAQCPASLADVMERETSARRREELNGLYVAMSRAKERLVFSATEPFRPVAAPSWWQRVAPHALAWQPLPAEPGGASAAASVSLDVLPRWHGPASSAEPASVAGNEAARLGQATHRVLEWAAATRAAPPDLDALAAAAAQEFAADAAEVARLAARIWHSPHCARFFGGPALHWAGNEVPISHAGEVLRIDRLVALDDAGRRTWWVLDYKLQHAPQALAAYRDQLLRYRSAVSALQPGDAVRCAFITGAGEVVEL
jgi:ATP-dependent helicase/nuclease subunit A